MIEVKGLSLSFTKEYYALYNINLNIDKNEKVAILGEADSGKTTLLRAIAGLEPFNQGQILINKIPIKQVKFNNDVSLGYVSYKGVFFNNKTVLENLQYVMKIRKIDETNAKIKINQALRNYNIESLKHLKIKKLNEFQKVLVQLARISLRSIDIYLIDNVFKNLTKMETGEIVHYIKALQKNEALFLVATKEEKIAKELSDRIVKIKLGSIAKSEG